MSRRASSLVTSLGLFTILPVPPVAEIDRVQAGRAMRAFPLVGALLGLAAAAVFWGADRLGAPLLGAVGALAVLSGLTGGLHLDGVADTADGLGSRKGPDEALAIMKRSDIGPMGVITLLFVLLAEVTALASVASVRWAALALVVGPMVGRLAVVFSTTSSRPTARPGGFGALFHGVTSPVSAAANALAVTAVAVGGGWWASGWRGALLMGVAGLLALCFGRLWENHLRHRFGGLTGDSFGSMIELTQLVVLVLSGLCAGLL